MTDSNSTAASSSARSSPRAVRLAWPTACAAADSFGRQSAQCSPSSTSSAWPHLVQRRLQLMPWPMPLVMSPSLVDVARAHQLLERSQHHAARLSGDGDEFLERVLPRCPAHDLQDVMGQVGDNALL